jgi:hypothetical protein
MSDQTPNYVSSGTESIENSQSLFSGKNLIIIILLCLVILSLIGINFLNWVVDLLMQIIEVILPSIQDLLAMLGFSTGTIIKGSADLVADTAELGIDIAKGTTHSIGDLLINSNNPGIDESRQISLTEVINTPNINFSSQPQPAQSSEPIMTPICSQKPMAGWCYVGDYNGVRGCVDVNEHDKCMSGQIFANQSQCLNPNA